MRAISISLLLAGVLIFMWGHSEYVAYLVANRPAIPDQTKGHVLELQLKGGSSIFVTRADMYIEGAIALTGIALFAVGATGLKRHYPPGPKT